MEGKGKLPLQKNVLGSNCRQTTDDSDMTDCTHDRKLDGTFLGRLVGLLSF